MSLPVKRRSVTTFFTFSNASSFLSILPAHSPPPHLRRALNPPLCRSLKYGRNSGGEPAGAAGRTLRGGERVSDAHACRRPGRWWMPLKRVGGGGAWGGADRFDQRVRPCRPLQRTHPSQVGHTAPGYSRDKVAPNSGQTPENCIYRNLAAYLGAKTHR